MKNTFASLHLLSLCSFCALVDLPVPLTGGLKHVKDSYSRSFPYFLMDIQLIPFFPTISQIFERITSS